MPELPRLTPRHPGGCSGPQILAAWGHVSTAAFRGDEIPPQALSKQLFAQQPPWLRRL